MTRRKRGAVAVPQGMGGRIAPPPSFNEMERQVWREELELLRAGGFAEPADLGVFTLYCEVKARRDALKAELNGDFYYVTKSGFERAKERAKIMFAAEKQMNALQKQLGMGVAARQPAQKRQQELQREFDFTPPPVGKKERAMQESLTAGKETGWGDDLEFRGAVQ